MIGTHTGELPSVYTWAVSVCAQLFDAHVLFHFSLQRIHQLCILWGELQQDQDRPADGPGSRGACSFSVSRTSRVTTLPARSHVPVHPSVCAHMPIEGRGDSQVPPPFHLSPAKALGQWDLFLTILFWHTDEKDEFWAFPENKPHRADMHVLSPILFPLRPTGSSSAGGDVWVPLLPPYS